MAMNPSSARPRPRLRLATRCVPTLAFGSLLATGCLADGTAGDTRGETAAAELARVPGDITTTRGILRDSSALVEATVTEITTAYDESTGPRTLVELSTQHVHAGTPVAERFTLRFFGGPVPGGTRVTTSATITLIKGGRYLLFLRNRPWFYDPLLGAALRVEQVNGREVLVDPEQHPLTALTPEGLVFGAAKLFTLEADASGQHAAATLRAGLGPRDTARALDRDSFLALVREAIAVEGVSPNGTFPLEPKARSNWRVIPTRPDAASSEPQQPAANPGAATVAEEVK